MITVLALFPSSIENNILNDLSARTTNALRTAEGLRSIKVSEGDVMSPGGPPPYSKVVEASFDSLESFMAWVQTPSAQDDKEQMMSNGVVMIFYETSDS